MITLRRVKSSSIRAIGYDRDAEELWIEYHSAPGGYVYRSVPQCVFTDLAKAESKGTFVNRVIKERFPYEYRRRPSGRCRPLTRSPPAAH